MIQTIRTLLVPALLLASLVLDRAHGERLFVPAADGSYLHRESKIRFPARVGTFDLAGFRLYNPAGTNLSAAYNSGFPPVAMTVYVYGTQGRPLRQEFAACQAELMAAHRGSQLIAHGNVMVSPEKHLALSATYVFEDRFGGKRMLLRSAVVLASGQNRFIKYRFTFPANYEPDSQTRASEFLKKFSWR